MSLKQVSLAELVEDFDLYPRDDVDSVHVSDLVRAIQAGDILPPIVVDAKTKRIVDGFHRKRALVSCLGDAARVEVDLRQYKTEADLFLDAVRLNAAHGAKLSRQDQRRIVILASKLKLNEQQIAIAMHVPQAHVQHLSVQVFHPQEGGMSVPGKRGFGHVYGHTLTRQQLKVIDGVRSGNVVQPCRELVQLLDAKLVDLTDGANVQALESAVRAIQQALKSRRKTA